MLSHARAYVKEERDHLRVIYDTLTALKDEKNLNIITQELREVYIKDRNALKKRKKVKKKHDIVDVFWDNMLIEKLKLSQLDLKE